MSDAPILSGTTVQVRIPAETLKSMVRQMAPLRLRFTTGIVLELGSPYDMALVPDQGLRVSCSGWVRFESNTLSPTTEIRHAIVMLSPKLWSTPEATWLGLDITILSGDLALVPSFVEETIIDRVNNLLRERTNLSVNLDAALRQNVAVPAMFETIRAFHLAALSGSLRVESDGLVAQLDLGAGFERASHSPLPPVKTPLPSEAHADLHA